MRRLLCITALVAGLGSAFGASSFDSLFPPKVVVKGEGFTLTDQEIDAAFLQFKATSASRGEAIRPGAEPALKKMIQEKLISEKLLFLNANEEDRKKGREATDKYLKNAKEQAGSEESYNRQIKTLGLDPADFEKKIYEKASGDMLLARELKTGIKISDEQAKAYYEENKEVFKDPEMVKAAHILIMTADPRARQALPQEEKLKKRSLANRLQERAKSGENFDKLVEEFSDDTASAPNKGVYTFKRGQMVPTFESAAFSMKAGQISDVVETQYGYHIIKVLEQIPAKQVPYEDVETQIIANLEYNEFEKLLPDFLKKLRDQSKIEIIE